MLRSRYIDKWCESVCSRKQYPDFRCKNLCRWSCYSSERNSDIKNGLAKEFTPGMNDLVKGTDELNTRVSGLVEKLAGSLETLPQDLSDIITFAQSTQSFAKVQAIWQWIT